MASFMIKYPQIVCGQGYVTIFLIFETSWYPRYFIFGILVSHNKHYTTNGELPHQHDDCDFYILGPLSEFG